MPTIGRVGQGGVLAIPGKRFGANSKPVGRTIGSRPFRSPPLSTTNSFITGVTRDSAGAALGNCVVQLFRTVDDAIIYEGASDGSGNFSIYAPVTGPFYLVAYKAGSPDVAGTTVNTLVGT